MFPYLFSFLFFFITTTSAQATSPSPIEVDVYLTSTCPHCLDAHRFFSTYTKTHHDIHVHYHWINKSRVAITQFHSRLLKEKKIDFSVPAFFFCDAHWTGFSTVIQQELIQNLSTCQKQLSQHLSSSIIQKSLQEKNELMRSFNQIYVMAPSLFFIPVAAIFDLLSPCSLFFFITFLIFIYLSDQAAFSLKMGMTSLAGLSCGLFINLITPTWRYMILQSSLFHLIAFVPALLCIPYIYKGYRQVVVSAHLDHPVFTHSYPLLSTNSLRSVCVYVYQQTCSFSLSPLFDMWVTITPTTPLTYILLIMSYVFIYLLIPITILLICYYQKKRASSEPRTPRIFSQTTALLFLGLMSLILIIQPSILSSFGLSLATLLTSSLIGWGIAKRYNRS